MSNANLLAGTVSFSPHFPLCRHERPKSIVPAVGARLTEGHARRIGQGSSGRSREPVRIENGPLPASLLKLLEQRQAE
jgi:hypothetical protein